MGLPLHPLVIHAAVVFVPLLVLAGLAYAFVPRLRPRIGWVAVLLALVAPLILFMAKLSGDAFRARMEHKGLATPAIFAKIDNHRSLGTITLYLTIALALVVLALVLLRNQPRVVSLVLVVLTVGLGLASVYYVYRTGDAGAKIVWTGY
jgi:predicted ferric reductase